MVDQIKGFIELVAAIIYTTETYQTEEINSDSQARMAKNYLTAFPDLLWGGSTDKEPAESSIIGGVAVASYLGATISSAFEETNL
jgi:hypothetical protein